MELGNGERVERLKKQELAFEIEWSCDGLAAERTESGDDEPGSHGTVARISYIVKHFIYQYWDPGGGRAYVSARKVA